MPIDQDTCALRWIAGAAIAASLVAEASAFAQEVTLPLAEYDALRQRAAPPAVVAPSSPTPIVLEAATVELVVGRDQARVTLDMALTISEDGWQQLALPLDGNVTSVALGGLEGRLSSGASSKRERVLFCRGVGRYSVRIGSVVPVTTERAQARPTRRVALTLPWAGTITGTLRSDDDTDEIELVTGAFADGTSGPGRIGFIGEPGGSFRARLLGRTDGVDERELPLLFEASSFAMTRAERSRVVMTGYLELEILQGRMPRVRVPVPEGMDVLAVEGATGDELGWDIDSEGELLVRFTEPVTGTVPIRLSFARSFPAGEGLERFEAPVILAENASRMTLVSGVSASDDGIPILLRASSARRATEEDLSFLPASSLSENATLFVVRDRDLVPVWRIEWAEADPTAVLTAQVDRLVVDALVGEASRIACQYWAIVRSPGASALAVEPPPGFTLVRAEQSGRRVTAGRTADGIVVPLAAGSQAQVVRLSGIVEAPQVPERGAFTIPIPALSAPVARVEVRAVVPRGRRYEIDSGEIDNRIGPAPAGAGSWFAVPASHKVVTASWSALDARPSPLEIRIRPQREKRRWY